MSQAEGEVWASRRFADEWESIPFLLGDRPVHWLADGEVAAVLAAPAALFLWPYQPLAPQMAALPAGERLLGWQGPLIQGDLEPAPYALYWGYRLDRPAVAQAGPQARFAGGIDLLQANVLAQTGKSGSELRVALVWQAADPLEVDYTVFVHVVDTAGNLWQHDGPPAGGTLPTSWWHPGWQIVDEHAVSLPAPYDPTGNRVLVGLYRRDTLDRLDVLDAAGQPVTDAVVLNVQGG